MNLAEYASLATIIAALLALVGWLVSGFTEATYNDSSILMMFYLTMGLALTRVKD